ncbi:hypothetical protein SAMN04487968_12026 [Nocardioides terrae]|uniref:Copper chaperone CopZ n=1 Tax=Nocardioides terrae TaxID=574651 RepID=A0A1I1NTR2_9ACTN|nr:heavy metal-associated domain-containing protein [Nocardioides terrae]SFD00815.1 hypothetical protein SAMN04487968_12026 [Nocardioides terrae]
MMRDTPRTFVGSVVLLLEAPVGRRTAEDLPAAIGALPGIVRCEVDVAAATLVVTAEDPVERADVVAAVERLGCRVRR